MLTPPSRPTMSATPLTSVAQVEIARTSQYAGAFRSITIFVDRTNIAMVRNGATLRYEVTPGTHEVYARIDWQRTKPVWSSQDLVDTAPPRLMGRFKLLRTYTAQMTMTANWIVEPIDVVSYIVQRK